MNILLVCPHLKIGGVPRYVINLAKGLKTNGNNVVVATFGGVWEAELIENDIEILKIPLNTKSILSFKILRSAVIINDYLKNNKIDIIHANTRVAQFLTFIVKSFHRRIKTVSTYHGYYKAHFFRRLFKFEGDSVISISNEIKRHINADLNICSDKISVVYNGIDISNYTVDSTKDELRNKYKIDGKPILGIVARLVEEKNHRFLIRSFKLFADNNQNAKLVVFGKGRMKEKLQSLVNELDLCAKVFFIDEGEVKEIFKTFDIAILPSTHEGFGFTIIEAQAIDIPVIGSPIGGIKEVINDNETGILFNKFDESLLCDKITELINNPDKMSDLVRNAKDRLKSTFSLTKMTKDTEKVYSKLLKS